MARAITAEAGRSTRFLLRAAGSFRKPISPGSRLAGPTPSGASRVQVVVRNEGVAPDDRYAPDDPSWLLPTDSLPEGLKTDEPLAFEGAISDEEDIPADD
jgi:hypothetical protein